MKTNKIIFWTTTSIIFLFEGVLPALTGHTDMAKQGIAHLGFPDYFRIELNILKVLGALALILPMVPARIKEWAYFGFAINMLSAFIGHAAVDGINGQTFFPLIVMAILIVSYVYYHKSQAQKLAVA
jgi:hypothetical protein